MPRKICIIGSGNWGSAIAQIVGETVVKNKETFDEKVVMWVFEEKVDGKNLSEIINEHHENVKYLPGHKLPKNIVACPDLLASVKEADILIHVVPHQFVPGICKQIKDVIKPGVINVSLIKARFVESVPYETWDQGLSEKGDGTIKLISELISDGLNTPCHVLMGANLAREVAEGFFCEATIGSKSKDEGLLLKKLFQTDNFRIVVADDAHTVELCGALKRLKVAEGFCEATIGSKSKDEGLLLKKLFQTDNFRIVVADDAHTVELCRALKGDNTKAAVIRLGLMEMTKFIELFYPGSNLATFFESCGIADLVTTCYGGRNRKVCEAFVKTGKSIEVLEKEMLGGQSLQGPHTCALVYKMIETAKQHEKFPLFCAIHKICTRELKPEDMVKCLRHHPEHL